MLDTCNTGKYLADIQTPYKPLNGKILNPTSTSFTAKKSAGVAITQRHGKVVDIGNTGKYYAGMQAPFETVRGDYLVNIHAPCKPAFTELTGAAAKNRHSKAQVSVNS